MTDRITLTFDGPVAEICLTRPDKRNGLDAAMFAALVDAGLALRDRRDVRAVVLHGEGPAFCAGLDFPSFLAAPDAMQHLLGRDDSDANRAQRAAWVWQELDVPVYAALHGAVFGGGLQVALGADVRYASPDARLSVMEARYGLVPDMALTQTLLRLVRADVAFDLVTTARVLDAAEAAGLGLITRVVDDPLATARAAAHAAAAMSPHAMRAAKVLLRDAPDLPRREALALEQRLQEALLGSPNQLEAVMAALAKRPAVFTDP